MEDGMEDNQINPLDLSDEDFAKLPMPGQVVEAPVEEPVIEDTTEQDEVTQDAPKAVVEEPKKEDEAAKSDDEVVDPSGSNEDDPKPTEEVKQDDTPAINYQAEYEKLMAGFKANGQTFVPRNLEEVVKLAQMGHDYTKKMMALQPTKKLVLMLENNGLLDEGKLDYLIALDKRDPEAIKKLIKDSGIDPLEIDTTTDPSYLGGNHIVSDKDALFDETLKDLGGSDNGKLTIKTIHDTWDNASKEAAYSDPEIMRVIHQQREDGIYDTIVTEINRRRTLGEITPNTPFLGAYKQVGDEIYSAQLAKAQEEATKAKPVQEAKPEVVAVTEAAPKKEVENGDKVAAAAGIRTTSKPAQKQTLPSDVFSMADEDFMKQFSNRNRS